MALATIPDGNPEICASLETILERARRGEVRSIGYAAIYSDDSWQGDSVVDNGDELRLRGALETVILRSPNSEDEW